LCAETPNTLDSNAQTTFAAANDGLALMWHPPDPDALMFRSYVAATMESKNSAGVEAASGSIDVGAFYYYATGCTPGDLFEIEIIAAYDLGQPSSNALPFELKFGDMTLEETDEGIRSAQDYKYSLSLSDYQAMLKSRGIVDSGGAVTSVSGFGGANGYHSGVVHADRTLRALAKATSAQPSPAHDDPALDASRVARPAMRGSAAAGDGEWVLEEMSGLRIDPVTEAEFKGALAPSITGKLVSGTDGEQYLVCPDGSTFKLSGVTA
jgi:hypothetical protein